ncbi:MAG: hypothetical protein K0S41_3465 [Anaerocolumna sp.]|nr:hypothetical protein [Anaerocolumna sp.]
MKSNILKAILWGITIMVGLVLVDLIKGTEINFLLAVIGGLVMAIVVFLISLIFNNKKAKK